jgi:hypothetical protein
MPEEIERSLSLWLRIKARDNEITLLSEYASGCLSELIEQMYYKTGKKVVILIDEYDVPILNMMDKSSEEIKAMQKLLHAIYKVLKGTDEYIKFIFLTGVSKFTGLSIFSALNNLEDITLSKDYSALCGITQEELESNFSEHLLIIADELSRSRDELLDDIRQWYNGYSWDGKTSVYNPFSILLLFKSREFKNYWFDTDIPAFLIELIKKRNDLELFFQPVYASGTVFSSYDLEHLEAIPVLFQTGYLTIKAITREENRPTYQLEPPNLEVREAFYRLLFREKKSVAEWKR